MVIARVPHRCPGGCGRDVPHDQFACPAHWRELPPVYRARITAAYRDRRHGDHLRAMVEAVAYFERPAR